MLNYKKILISAVALLFSMASHAQVTIDQTMTPQELVEEILLGEGISVSNITFNGQPGNILNNQIGLYQGPSNFIDFDEGIVMASDDVIQVVGEFPEALTNEVNGDPDLDALANAGGTNFSINDCAI